MEDPEVGYPQAKRSGGIWRRQEGEAHSDLNQSVGKSLFYHFKLNATDKKICSKRQGKEH